MITTVSRYDFEDAFRKIRPDNFTYEGLKALFNHFEELEQDSGEQIELDVIAICCDYSEYAGLAEFQENYNAEEYPDMETVAETTGMYIAVGNGDGFICLDF